MAPTPASPFTRPVPHRATRRYRITRVEVAANILIVVLTLLTVYYAWPLILDFWSEADLLPDLVRNAFRVCG